MTSRFPACFILLSLVAAVAVAQENKDQPAAEKFAAVHKQWTDLDGKLGAIIDEFPQATAERRTELRKQYEEFAALGRKLMPQLRATAVAAFTESPNENKAVTDVLVGLTASDVHRDDYQGAAELSTLLIKHKSEDKDLLNLAGIVAFCTHDFEAAEKYLKQATEAKSLTADGERCLAMIENEGLVAHWKKEAGIRMAEARADDLPRVKLETSKGDIVLELFENEAPKTVGNFVSLVEKKFYDGLTFHRVLPGFMAQGGCPEGTGTGGPDYNVPCECYKEDYRKHFAGALSMAHAGRDTGGSQFFLTFRPTPHLDGKHTVFGRVVQGLDVLAKIQKIDPNSGARGIEADKILKASVLRKRDHKYEPTKVEP